MSAANRKMQRQYRDLPVVQSLRLVILAAIAIAVVYLLPTTIWPHHVFFREKEQILAILEGMEETPPAGTDADRWRRVWGIVYNGFGNVCFTREHVSIDEMRRLHAEVQRKSTETPSLDWPHWLWERLARTGPHGKEYIEQMTPLFEEAANGGGNGARTSNTDQR